VGVVLLAVLLLDALRESIHEGLWLCLLLLLLCTATRSAFYYTTTWHHCMLQPVSIQQYSALLAQLYCRCSHCVHKSGSCCTSVAAAVAATAAGGCAHST
jgi:hypothetical protein